MATAALSGPSATTSYAGITSSVDASGNKGTDTADQQDRFLKLLVAQLNNQDPMNPMDNAQMTSQIAQINTVTGIQQLNETMQGMATQFASLQVLQGASLVGKDVLTAGNTLSRDGNTAAGTFDLAGGASNVQVQVLTAGGRQLAVVPLGALEGGRHNFTWDASGQPAGTPLQYRVVAGNGSTAVDATPLTRDRVTAVSANNGQLQLQLGRGGNVAYGDVKAVL